MNSFFYGLMVLLAAGGFFYLLRYLRLNKLNPMGKGAEKKTTRILRRYGGIRGFRVLTDVRLEADGRTVVVENMLIGYFGILLVHTCGARGQYAGGLDTEEWALNVDEGKVTTTIPNPYREQQKAAGVLRALLSGAKIYNVPIEHLVYMTSASSKLEIYISNNGEILRPGELASTLGKARFDKDIGLDVNKVAEVILAAQSRG